MKKILGLDLGTSSIGWAVVNQAENDNEKSNKSIVFVQRDGSFVRKLHAFSYKRTVPLYENGMCFDVDVLCLAWA